MNDISNSDVMNHVMNSFFNVISTRTTPAHAWLTLKILMQKIEYNYNFIKSIDLIDIKDIKEMEYYQTKFKNIAIIDTAIVETVDEKIIGESVQSLADELKKYLGKKAGYHLLREFRDDLGDNYYSIINKMGVDLRLIELQDELYELDYKEYVMEDDNELNVAIVK